MYEWILMLMGYIDEMICWELKALRTNRMKFLLYVAAGIRERDGTENLVNPKKESGEGKCQQEYSTQQERRRRQRRTMVPKRQFR